MTGDAQQFAAEGHESREPKVTLIWMTPDPLGAIGAMSSMYSGRVVRDLNDLTHEDRMQALKDVSATHLRAPMESVKFHFLLENVDRALTHQLVRQRTAAYAQESLRFAVKGDLAENISMPPSLEGTVPFGGEDVEVDQKNQWRRRWDIAIKQVDLAYHFLVEDGMPAEEARGLLPHATLTRVHWVTDLRNLLEHAGNRLCTQAQFHWRSVYLQVREQISVAWTYMPPMMFPRPYYEYDAEFRGIAELFKPICYQLGRCPFQASFDRECTIRDRVNENAEHGVASKHWHEGTWVGEEYIPPIDDAEWAEDPGAARA